MRAHFSRIAFVTLLTLAGVPAAFAQWTACEQDCYTQNNVCMFGEYGTQTPTYWQIEQCDQIYQSCLDHCAHCPSTRDYTTRTLISLRFTGRARCLEDISPPGRGIRYFEATRTERITTYRETQQCDGSTSTSVLSTQNVSYVCWGRGSSSRDLCSPYGSNFGTVICPP